ncbi:maleylpyruvate isomerase family mycothiol-dependent enzyme [Nocardioides dongkuii]|uniref:maleylpyruvate isomerase family mycothiol-dependent enzyme n=1 Tax=Nocardioides dongkuii TaxID=2760089 RepID=UPI0015F9FB1B|nr:maleylpyruvate isomerase family mycothiol-dependent enzyme [Nocardioides dongkuii]
MDESVWQMVREERASLAELASSLTAAQWATTSLCTEWTVHDVVAHVVMTPAGEPTLAGMARAMVRARGRLWNAGRDVVRAYARTRTPGQLVARLDELAGARTKPVFVVDDNILLDVVVHGQDVAVPLGVPRPVPDATARVALERAWRMGWPFHPRRRLLGVRLRCESADGAGTVWEAGEGPEVTGSAGALALLMTARTDAALAQVRGDGVAVLADRLLSA